MAFVLGYTGETGKALVKELSRRSLFKKIVLIGRREVQLDKNLGPEFEQRVVDFDRLNDHKDTFEGLDTGFCCIGTTRGKAGKDGFIKVDHDYVVNSAEVAKSVGCKHFLLVTAYGANKDSSFLYPKTKGKVEEELKALDFDRLSIFRPGMLLCDRQESRLGESVLRFCFKAMPNFVVKATAISTDNLAKAMVNRVSEQSSEKIEIIENKQLYDFL